MKYNPVYLVGITATVVARAADITTVPDCASGCIDKLVSEYTPCNSKDFGCICNYQETLHLHGAQCIIDSCGVQKATVPLWKRELRLQILELVFPQRKDLMLQAQEKLKFLKKESVLRFRVKDLKFQAKNLLFQARGPVLRVRVKDQEPKRGREPQFHAHWDPVPLWKREPRLQILELVFPQRKDLMLQAQGELQFLKKEPVLRFRVKDLVFRVKRLASRVKGPVVVFRVRDLIFQIKDPGLQAREEQGFHVMRELVRVQELVVQVQALVARVQELVCQNQGGLVRQAQERVDQGAGISGSGTGAPEEAGAGVPSEGAGVPSEESGAPGEEGSESTGSGGGYEAPWGEAPYDDGEGAPSGPWGGEGEEGPGGEPYYGENPGTGYVTAGANRAVDVGGSAAGIAALAAMAVLVAF
ncbi:hypothetical protein SLS53_008994 [Cytospora paraplurivora]|uniref:CFEM domain-containing protein n=1 Tax=Cytospora paraplurivora TaxID=2898453 RepID=A0AAN9TZZ7_9PEZI